MQELQDKNTKLGDRIEELQKEVSDKELRIGEQEAEINNQST